MAAPIKGSFHLPPNTLHRVGADPHSPATSRRFHTSTSISPQGCTGVEDPQRAAARGRASVTRARPVSFEIPRAVPAIGLPLGFGRRVPHGDIERGHDGAGDYQDCGDEDHRFSHVTVTQLAYGRSANRTRSACQLPKCTFAVPIYRATKTRFRHCPECVDCRLKICRGNCRECTQCGADIIAPEWAEHLSDHRVRNVWSCEACEYQFEDTVYLAREAADAD